MDDEVTGAGHNPSPRSREELEAALRASEARYRTLVDAIDEGFCIFEMIFDAGGRPVDFRYLEANEGFARQAGRRPKPGQTMRELFPEAQDMWLDVYARVARTGRAQRFVDYSEGLDCWFDVVVFPTGAPAERMQLAALFTDVTEKKRAEERLRGSEERLQAIANLVPDLLWSSEPDGSTTWYNQRWLEYTGQSFEEAVGWGWNEAIHPDDRDGSARRYQEAVEGSRQLQQEHRIRGASGEYRWFLVRAEPLRGEDGRVARMYSAATDIHELRLATEALRKSEERYRLIVEGARDYAILTTDLEGTITSWSPGAAAVFGWDEKEACGRDIAMTFTPEDRERGAPDRERATAQQNGAAPDVRWHVRKEGTRVFIEGTVRPLKGTDGGVRGFLKIGQDVTDRRKAEEALREAMSAAARANADLERRVEERTRELLEVSELRQELLRQLVTAQEEERGRIARDLHDDTGQQVTGLLLGLERLARSSVLADDLSTRDTLRRLQELASDVAEKSHRLAMALRPTVLDDVGLVPALTQYAHEWGHWSGLPVEVEAIGLEKRLPRELETTIYRIAQEALTNILRHGRGETAGAGATRVSILIQQRKEELLTVIEDDGPGFDVEQTRRLPLGQRRLGIFGMQERARLAGGTLTIESEPGQGTSLFLRLPLPSEGPPHA